MNPAVEDLRRKGVILVTIGGWLEVLSLGVMAMPLGANALSAAALAALLACYPTYCMIKGTGGSTSRLLIGVIAAIEPSLLLFALQGSVWQLDMQLFLFVALAALTLLCDIRPIITACGVIAFHNVVFALAAPELVFWGGGGLLRGMLHAAAIVMIGAILCWVTKGLKSSLDRVMQTQELNAKQARTISDKDDQLTKAREAIELEKADKARARTEILEARKAAYEGIAADFERSVSAVTHSVSSTAQMLERTARELKLIANKAGIEARDVVGSAESTSKAANTVAAGVAELSMSIADIAANASQQSDLSAQAKERSGGGGKAIGSLTERSKTIGEATRAIVRIAERTDLLSLNAAIEAASAGPSGRGFSIVAHEVKALAGQAAEAATEIDTFLTGVWRGTIEADRSFKAIDSAITELGESARLIRYDVENQQQSADTIEVFARNAAAEGDDMVGQMKSLAERAIAAKNLSDELDQAASALAENVKNLERSSSNFTSSLKAA